MDARAKRKRLTSSTPNLPLHGRSTNADPFHLHPLSNKIFFLDLPKSTQTQTLLNMLKTLGAKVEPFFHGPKVTHIITNRRTNQVKTELDSDSDDDVFLTSEINSSRKVSSLSHSGFTTSASALHSPRKSLPSSSSSSKLLLSPQSRGRKRSEQLLTLVKTSKEEVHADVLTLAKKMGKPVLQFSEVVPWLEQECERKKQENGMTEQMKNESLQSEDVFIAPAVYMNFDEISLPLFWMENNGWKKVKNATQQKSKPKEKMKPTAPAKIQGYCENCRVAFTDMIKHLESPSHVRWRENSDLHYKAVDALLS